MYRPLHWAFHDLRGCCQLDAEKRELYLEAPTRNFTRQRTLTWASNFGWHQNQHHAVPSTRWLAFFDLLNQQLIDLHLHPRSTGESRMALPLIEQLESDMIAIYDRGFGGYALPWMHRQHGSHCIIRLIKTVSPTVVKFLRSGASERIFTSALSSRALASIRACGLTIETGASVSFTHACSMKSKTGMQGSTSSSRNYSNIWNQKGPISESLEIKS